MNILFVLIIFGMSLGVLFLAGSVWLRLKYPRGYVTPPRQFTQKLYSLVDLVDEVLTSHGIPYWAAGGTLIGAVRSGDLIPWDDDVDICIPIEYAAELEFALQDLHQCELELHSYSFGKKIGYQEDPLEADRAPSAWVYFWRVFIRSNYPYIDIFFMESNGNAMQYVSEIWRARSPRESLIYQCEVFPLRRYPFGPISLNGPAQAEAYLTRAFGEWHIGQVEMGHHIPRIYHALALFMRHTIPADEI